MDLAVGQIWKEVDPRAERFVRIESVGMGRRNVSIRTVVKRDFGWSDAPRSRLSYADGERFDGRRGGYEFHEAPQSSALGCNANCKAD